MENSFKKGFDTPKNRVPVDEDYYNELIARFGETLAPLINRYGYEGIESIGMLLARLTNEDPRAAVELLEKSPAIIEELMKKSEQLVLNVYGLGNQLTPYGARLAVKFLEMSPRYLEAVDFDTLAKVAGTASTTAHTNIHTALVLIEQGPSIIDAIGFEGLTRIAAYGTAIARSSFMNSVKAVEKSAFVSRRLADEWGIQFVYVAYELASQIAAGNWTHGISLMEKSSEIARKLNVFGDIEYVISIFKETEKAVPLGSKFALTLLETTPCIIEHLERRSRETVWKFFFDIAAALPEKAIVLLESSAAKIENLLIHFDTSQIVSLFVLGDELAGYDAGIAYEFVSRSPEFAGRIDLAGIGELKDLAMKIAKISLAAAASFIEAAPALLERLSIGRLALIADLACETSRVSWETASRLMEKSPDIIAQAGIDGLKLIGSFAAELSKESSTSAASLIDRSPAVTGRLLTLGGYSLFSQVYETGVKIAKYNARLAVSFIHRSPDIIEEVGFAGLERIEELMHRIGQKSWSTAVSLIEESSEIITRSGFEGLETIAAVAERISRANNYGAVSLIEKSPDLITRLLGLGDIKNVLHVYSLAGLAAESNWRTAATLLEKSYSLVSMIGFEGLEKLSRLILEVAEHSQKISTRILDLSPSIIERAGYEGLEAVCGYVLSISKENWTTAMSVIEKSPELIERLVTLGDKTTPLQVYKIASSISAASRAAAVRLLEKSPDLIHLAGMEGFVRIAAHVEKVASDDEEKALSFLRADSIEFTDFMENIPKGLELKAVRPVLSSYLKALLGRRVEIAEAEKVSTDGIRIYLPRRVKEFREDENNFTFYKVITTHQEAHLEYGSFEFDMDLIRDAISDLQSFYGKIPDKEKSDIEMFFHLFPEPDLAADLFNIIEDYRIDTRVKGEYPVLGRETAKINLHNLKKRPSLKKMTNLKQRAVEMIARSLSGGVEFQDRDDEAFATWSEAVEKAGSVARISADVHDSARTAAEIYRIIDENFTDAYRQVTPMSKPVDQDMIIKNVGSFGKTSKNIAERLQGSHKSSPPSKPVASESPPGKDAVPTDSLPQTRLNSKASRRTGDNQRTYQGDTPGAKQQAGDSSESRERDSSAGGSMKYDSAEIIERLLRTAHRDRGITPKEIERRLESLHPNDIYLFLHNLEVSLKKKTELESERGTTLYPEWGEDISGYRSNWARIREQLHKSTSLDFYRETADRHAGLLKKIRREFQMLKPEGFRRLKRQYDGDEIDLDAVVEHLVDRKVGLTPSEKNYTLIRKKRRDIAVALLVDMSRSTKGSTIEKEKEALVIMSEALYEVGDVFAIYGFSGDNRDNVDFYLIKDFDTTYNERIKKRISAIEDRFENRDGAAIRHTISKLRRRPERTKLIILLSDGKPVDKEYAGNYAIEDTRMALKEAQHYGIKTFCVTVDKSAAGYLPRMYSHSSWTVIDDVAKLPEKITRIYRMLTA